MKIVATNKCQLGGRIYDVGDTANYDGPITDRIIFNFSAEDGKPLVSNGAAGSPVENTDGKPNMTDGGEKEKIASVLKAMNREQIIAKLEERGITYKPAHKNEYLAKLYLQSMGEVD